MSENHTGNVLNSITQEEHDGVLNAKRVVSAATIYAVVNTSAAGVGQSIVTVANPVAISSAPTLFAVVNTGAVSDPKTFIGLTTTVIGSSATIYAVVNTSAAGVGQSIVTVANPVSIAGNVTLDPGSRTGILGNVTLSDSKTFIGLVTVGNVVSTTFSGNVTIDSGTITTITNPVAIKGNLTLSDSKTFIGLVTVGNTVTVAIDQTGTNNDVAIVGNVTLSDSKTFIGLVTVVQGSVARTITGNVTLSDAKTFIGLVTAWTQNAGTTKALIPIPVALSTSSQATIAVPATNLSIYVTSLLLNSNATVRVNVKSGVTYLTGNASIGITLNPGGGWVETGSPDAPVYRSTPSASINIEKFDLTGTIASVSGKVVYYTE